MIRRMRCGQRLVAVVVSTLILISASGRSYGALVYWQNFEGGDGVADAGVGDLGITNTGGGSPGNTFFSTTNGVVGGSYDATNNVTANNSANFNGIASSAATGGTALSALPNSGTLNQFTISFWMKTQTLGTSARGGRLLALGQAGTTDILNANSVGFAQIGTGVASVSKIAPYFGTTDLTNALGIGAANNLNEWTFVAISYDGASSNGDNSATQLAATGSSINGQFYRGTDTTSVVRSDLPFVTTVGTPSSSSLGSISVGTTALLYLANRPALTRAYDGWIDDVRIYDSVLTADDIETVRLQGIGVPEPASLLLIGLSIIGVVGLRSRRTKV
jgi:hypothetical protein